MKKILTFIFIWATMVGLSACLDDNNNYNYSEVNKLEKAGIGGMRDEYFLVYQQELTITPTFEFTIDKENPDVSYEWRLDGVLLQNETNPSCTFSFEEGGVHEVTYTVVDNKTGVKFSKSCTLKVRSPFARGWLVLTEDGQQSKLSFVGANSVSYRLTVTDGTTTAEIDRDSLVSIGVDRMFLQIMSAAYCEEDLSKDGKQDSRVVLRLPAALAPVKMAIMPLVKKDGLPEKAQEIMNLLKYDFNCQYDEKDSIGKRYRRQDAIGTPFCITVDHQTLEDHAVTIRDRDTMQQERVAIDQLFGILKEKCDMQTLLRKMTE